MKHTSAHVSRPALVLAAIVAAGAPQVAFAGLQGLSAPGSSSKQGDIVVTAKARRKPVDAPPPLDLFAAAPKFEYIALSPDGDRIAFTTTLDALHILTIYRISDKSHRYVKLEPGEITGIAWADDNHVLISDTRAELRGTCLSNDIASGDGGASARDLLAGASASALSSTTTPANAASGSDAAANAAASAAQTALLNALDMPPCVYYGARLRSAMTSVNADKGAWMGIGEHFGDYPNQAIDTLQPLAIGGKTVLMGPFLELRGRSVNTQPKNRVYLWNVDLDTGAGKLIEDGGGDLDRRNRYVDNWLYSPTGELLARSSYVFRNESYIIEVKTKGGWRAVLKRQINAHTHTFAPALLGLGRTEGSLVILDAAPGESEKPGLRTFHYYELSADGKLSPPLEPDDAATDHPMFDPVSNRLIGFAQSGESETYRLFDPELQKEYQKAQDAVPVEQVRVAARAARQNKMIIYAQGDEDPGAYYYIDFDTGQTASIGEDFEQVPTAWIASQTSISYAARDGMQIHGLLTYPPKPPLARELPLVVLPHDGLQAHDALSYDWLAQALASRGYLVLQPNVRGSDGYGLDYIAAGSGELTGKMQTDLSDGVRYLVSEGLADPKRVCILGIGYGGFDALSAAAGDAATYRCAASINGISDLGGFASWQQAQYAWPSEEALTSLMPDPKWPRGFVINPKAPDLLKRYRGAADAASPLKRAGQISIPVLIAQQGADHSVPSGQSWSMYNALKSAGKVAVDAELPGSDHTLQTPPERLAALKAVTEFLARYNPAE